MRDALRSSPTLTIRTTRFAIGLVVLAFALRLAVRLAGGADGFEEGGYDFYADIARNVQAGQGFCRVVGEGCALRTPVYPALLLPFLVTGGLYPGLVVLQAALGASLVWVAFILGRRLFDAPSGVVAAFLTAVSPYAVIHDTALQETVVVNVLIAIAAHQLVVAVDRDLRAALMVAGLAVAIAILTTARVALVAPVVAAWLVVGQGGSLGHRLSRLACFVLPVVMLVGGWMVRNWRVVGAPVLTTESGASLWIANNPETFRYFPAQSVDLIVTAASTHLTETELQDYAQLFTDPVAQDRLAREWAINYIAAHPGESVIGAARKLWVAVSAELSPTRSVASSLGYRVLYGAVHLMAVFGVWRVRRAWRRHGPIYAVLAAFGLTTAIFWAHTSHKSLVDVFLFTYAASVISPVVTSRIRFAPDMERVVGRAGPAIPI